MGRLSDQALAALALSKTKSEDLFLGVGRLSVEVPRPTVEQGDPIPPRTPSSTGLL